MLIVYGIRNCDTVKKARHWLEDQHIDYKFHDYRISGINTTLLESFLSHYSWQELINTKGLTWRRLSPEQRANVKDKESAIAIMLQYPVIIRRPIIIGCSQMVIGFNLARYHKLFNEVKY